MTTVTLTRADLSEELYSSVGISRHDASAMVDQILEEIAATLAGGEIVKISSFGTFGLRDKRERVGRNPKTGKEVPISPRRVLMFRASHTLKEAIEKDLGSGSAAKRA